MVVITRRMVGILALLVVLTGSFAFLDTRRVDAVDGTVGPITFTVTPSTQVNDGQPIAIHAQAADGVLIYELKAHLCVPNANLRTNFDFGFQGKKCTNAPVGAGDTEQIVSFPNGATAGDLDTFKVGVGTVHWVNELGYDQTIDCGPGKQCDVVVRAQITNGTAFFTVPLCYGRLPAEGAPPVDPAAAAPPPSDPPASTEPPAAASGSAAGGPTSAGGNASGGTNGGGAAGANGSGTAADGSEQALAATGTTVPSPHDLSPRSRVLLAAGATAGAAVLIAWIVARGIRKTREI